MEVNVRGTRGGIKHMKYLRTTAKAVILLAGMVSAAATYGCGAAEEGAQREAAKPASPEAAAVVTTLYQDHFAHEQNWAETYRRQRALFAPQLAALLEADDSAAAANPDEVVGLDFDPLTDAQESMTAFEVGASTGDASGTVVPVALRLDSARSEVRVRLVQSGREWRVANVTYPHGDLVTLLRQLAADRGKR